MYKTVRQGENSLQYTILPQQDESCSGGGAAGGKHGGERRGRRRLPLLLAAALVLAAMAAAAGVLLPLAATGHLADALPDALRRLAHARSNVGNMSAVAEPAAAASVVAEAAGTGNHSATVDYDDSTTDVPSTAASSSTSEPSTTVTEIPSTEAPSTVAATSPPSPPPPSTSAAPPPPPPPAATHSALPPAGAIIPTPTPGPAAGSTTAKGNEWRLGARWPLGDPSAYLQWTGFRARDGLVLPLILLATLAALALLAAGTCIVLRRRRASQLRRQAIGEMSSELQSEDKSTLLVPDGSEED